MPRWRFENTSPRMPPQFAKKTAQRRLLGEGAAEVGTQRLHRYWPAPPPPPGIHIKVGSKFQKNHAYIFHTAKNFSGGRIMAKIMHTAKNAIFFG